MKSIVSIIVPVYNCASDLHRSIGSLLNQTMTEWTAICVDDGSTDESGTLLDEYAAKDSRINVIHQENRGAAAARNKGLDATLTEYIVMLDADDEWDVQALEKMCEAINNTSCDLVTTGMKFRKANGEVFYRPFPISGHIDNDPHFFAQTIHKGPVPFLFRKSIIDKYQIRFPEDVTSGEDYLFIYSYGICTKRIYGIQECLYTYTYLTRFDSLSTSFYYGKNPFTVYKTYVEQPLRVQKFLYSAGLDNHIISQYNYELSRDFWRRYHSSCIYIRNKKKKKELEIALRKSIRVIYSKLTFGEKITLMRDRYPHLAHIWHKLQASMPRIGMLIKLIAKKINSSLNIQGS